MIPENDNVYGIFTARHSLEPVLRAIKEVVAAGRVYIYRSQFNGAETLHLESETAQFESEPLDGGVEHLFSGGVSGSLDEVIRFVQRLSESLSLWGIEHSFEVYDGQQLV